MFSSLSIGTRAGLTARARRWREASFLFRNLVAAEPRVKLRVAAWPEGDSEV